MKKTTFFLCYCFTVLIASCLPGRLQAQTSATSTLAGTVTITSVANGFDWTNPGNIQNADAVYATSSITGSNKSTYYLDAKNWGFQSTTSGQPNYIPPGATINGIQVTITWRKTGSGTIKDNKIILLKAGAEAGNSNAKGTLWPSTAAPVIFGSSVDLWGTTWTGSDLTNTNFGVRIQAKNQGSRAAQAEIDYVTITVFFNQVFFYSKSTGNLELTASWGTNTDGTGTAPSNFTTDGQVFFLRNRTTASLTANLIISGTNSKLVIGDGTSATTLTIPSNYILTAQTDIAAASALTNNNTTNPTINSIATNTTVTYGAASNQNVQEATYYNLTLSGSGSKLLQTGTDDFTTVNNVLTIASGVTFNNQGNNVFISGATNGISNSGTASGSGRFVYSVLDVSTSITGTGTGTYSNLEIDFGTTAATRTATLGNASTVNGTLYLTDGTLANGTNLTMAAGSALFVTDGTLGSTLTSTGYDVTYNAYATSSPKTTANEITGTVRNLTLQTGTGFAVNLNRNLVLTGNLTLTSGTLDPTTSNYNITIGGNFANNATLTARNNTFTLNGSAVQSISSAAASQSFYNLVVNNASGGSVQLSIPVVVTNGLTLTNGIVTSSSTNTLTLAAGATVSSGNSSSYINGPLTATLAATSGNLSFPVGKSSSYRLASLALNQVAAASTTYTAELFSGAPTARTLPGTLSKVSQLRYYTISCSNNGNVSSANVTINYTNDGVTDAPNLRIAKSNGSNWVDIGGTGSAAGTGTITSGSFSTFSDFVLANAIGGANPLPLEWISFTSQRNGQRVVLSWETAHETNTAGFDVQRSSDGTAWTVIGNVATNNTTYNRYQYTDGTPLAGVNYYRIRYFDRDDATGYSSVATVNFNQSQNGITVAPNPVRGSVFRCLINDSYLLQQATIHVTAIAVNGKTVLSYDTKPASALSIHHRLANGVYTLIISSGGHQAQCKLLIQLQPLP